MFSKNFSRVFTRHHWIQLCCCVLIVGYVFVAEAHEAFPGFVKRGEVFGIDVRPVCLDSALEFRYGLQEKTVDAFWPMSPVKEGNTQFGNDGLTEDIFRFSPSVFFASSPGEIMMDGNLESNTDCRTDGNRQGLESEWPNHIANVLLGLLGGFILGELITLLDDESEDQLYHRQS